MPFTVLQTVAMAEMSARRLGYVIVDGQNVWAEDVRRDADMAARVAAHVFGVFPIEVYR